MGCRLNGSAKISFGSQPGRALPVVEFGQRAFVVAENDEQAPSVRPRPPRSPEVNIPHILKKGKDFGQVIPFFLLAGPNHGSETVGSTAHDDQTIQDVG
jgi:hypothetical protein